MFITTQQLFELKYRLGGQYYSLPLAEIFFREWDMVNRQHKLPILTAINSFFHAFVEENLCLAKFDDDSYLVIEKDENEKWSIIKICESHACFKFAEFRDC